MGKKGKKGKKQPTKALAAEEAVGSESRGRVAHTGGTGVVIETRHRTGRSRGRTQAPLLAVIYLHRIGSIK